MARSAGIFLVLLALLLLLPAPCPAADSTAEPAPNSAPAPPIDPDMDEGHRQFAHANYEKALEHYLKALERNEEDAYLYFRVWLTYYILGEFNKSDLHRIKAYNIDNNVTDGLIYKTTSNDMFPTLYIGDITAIDDKYYYKNLNYGDIISFVAPYDNGGITSKRVVGLPGDYIKIIDNTLLRNGKITEEEYVHNNSPYNPHAKTKTEQYLVQDDCYFVLGDNRNWGYDSRYYGCIHSKNIIGKDIVVIESVEEVNGEVIQRKDRVRILIK